MAKLIKGKNDFATEYPELAKEWHPTKNGSLTPSDITAGSGKIVWWLGKCGHEWCTVLYSRTRLNSKCPYCANQKVLSGYNDLATTNPELAEEWHPTKNGTLKATEIAEGSNKKVWWLGKCGHEWVATPNDRKGQKGTNCPYCSGQKLLVGFNDLQTVCPEIAEEWHPTKNGSLKPTDVVSGSPKYVWWMCKEGHEWKAKISNRKALDSWCPFCSGKRILTGFNDLATLCPELLKEWDYEKNTVQPTSIGKGYQKNIWWKCSKGHSYQASPNNRTKGDGCPICSKEYRTSFPEQAMFFYIKKVFPDAQNGNKTILDGMELDIYIPSLNTGIEYDGNNWHNDKRDSIKNDLCKAKGIRLIRIREHGLKSLPNSINIERQNNRSDADLERCILKVFREIGTEAPDISIEQDRMQITSEFIVSEKEKSFSSVHPELLEEWNYEKNKELTPEMVKAKSGRKVWWKCSKGHEWQSRIVDRGKGHGCPYCSGRKKL